MALKNKYQREKQQYSIDGGITWLDVTPPNYRKGRVIETASEDCNYASQYLTTEMLESGRFGFTYTNYFDPNGTSGVSPQKAFTNLAYSINGGEWTNQTNPENVILDVTQGDVIRWKALYYDLTQTELSSYQSTDMGYCEFRVHHMNGYSARYKVYGNIKSLFYGDNFLNYAEENKEISIRDMFSLSNNSTPGELVDAANLVIPSNIGSDACHNLFAYQSELVAAPELPATTLTLNCYYGMFYGCTSLATAPALPATTLANGCYNNMFYGCTSLVTAPELPATTMIRLCYANMFARCTSLVTAPELPAITLASDCYYGMFYGCTSLVTAPELPATILASGCYNGMFQSCTSLNYIKAMFTTRPSSTYTNLWVQNVAASGTFVKNSAATWNVTGNNGVPSGWTVETASS